MHRVQRNRRDAVVLEFVADKIIMSSSSQPVPFDRRLIYVDDRSCVESICVLCGAHIIGSITEFGRDDKKTNVGGGALGGVTGRFGIGGVSKTNSKAVVAVTARLRGNDFRARSDSTNVVFPTPAGPEIITSGARITVSPCSHSTFSTSSRIFSCAALISTT